MQHDHDDAAIATIEYELERARESLKIAKQRG